MAKDITSLHYNSLVVAGRVLSEPVSNQTNNKKFYCRFTFVAGQKTKERWVGSYFTCIGFGVVAEYIMGVVKKGKNLLLEGQLWNIRLPDSKPNNQVCMCVRRVHLVQRPNATPLELQEADVAALPEFTEEEIPY